VPAGAARTRYRDRVARPLALQAEVVHRCFVLRRWSAHDAAALQEAVVESRAELMPWLAWASHEPLTVDERRLFILDSERQWDAGTGYGFGIFVEDRVIGARGLHRQLGQGGLEIGYWIRTSCVGTGYATDATCLLTEIGFEVQHISRIEIRHDAANRASGRVAEKLGFTKCAELPSATEAPGGTGTEWVWRMTRRRWLATDRPGRRRAFS